MCRWERMDLVSQTTKRALEASLKKLLLQKPLNKITINDITEDCGVNRMTFYYHFKDIYDLVDWIMVEDAAKALEGRQSFENWTDAFLDILRQVQDNKVLVMNVYRSVSREQVEQYLYKLLDPCCGTLWSAVRRALPCRMPTNSSSWIFINTHWLAWHWNGSAGT